MNEKQQRFVQEYLKDLNATRAAKRAGYSEKTAYSQGQRLLKDVEVAEAVAEGMADRSARTEVTQDWVIERLRQNAENATEAAQFSAVNKALELLGKHVGMFSDKLDVKVTGADGGPVQLEAKRVVSIAEVIDLARELGVSDQGRVDSAASRRALPGAEDVLPDPSGGQ